MQKYAKYVQLNLMFAVMNPAPSPACSVLGTL